MNKKFYFFCLLIFVTSSCEQDEHTDLPPSNFLISPGIVTKNSAQLIWTPAIDPEGDPVIYEVRLQKTTIASNLSEDHYTLLNLDADTEYVAEVIAVDTKHNKKISSTTFRTLPQNEGESQGLKEIIFQKEIAFSGTLEAADLVEKRAGVSMLLDQ